MKKDEKKDYQKPELVEHGNLKEITQGDDPSGNPDPDFDS